MFCPRCGNQAPDDSAFCPTCGDELTAAGQVAWGRQANPGQIPPAQQYAPQSPVSLAAGKTNAGLIVGLSAGAVVLLLLASAGGFFAFSAMKGSVKPSAGGATATATAGASSSAASATAAAVGASTPQGAVDAWYVAVSKGDIAAIKHTATADFAAAIDPNMFEDRDPHVSYRVTGEKVDGDQATIDVQESPTNATAQVTMAFKLAKQGDGSWLVAGYTAAALTSPSTEAPSNSPIEPNTTTFGKAEAIDVVGRFLNDLRSGNGSVAKKLATARFKKANPGWIFGPISDYAFEVTGATQKGSSWVVTVREQWQSGPETPTYTVVVSGGQGLIDRRSGLN